MALRATQFFRCNILTHHGLNNCRTCKEHLRSLLDHKNIIAKRRAIACAPCARPHYDSNLFCHYKVEILDSEARFTVQRTPEDVMLLLEKAEEAGIRCAAGLYQELKQHAKTALQTQGGFLISF